MSSGKLKEWAMTIGADNLLRCPIQYESSLGLLTSWYQLLEWILIRASNAWMFPWKLLVYVHKIKRFCLKAKNTSCLQLKMQRNTYCYMQVALVLEIFQCKLQSCLFLFFFNEDRVRYQYGKIYIFFFFCWISIILTWCYVHVLVLL